MYNSDPVEATRPGAAAVEAHSQWRGDSGQRHAHTPTAALAPPPWERYTERQAAPSGGVVAARLAPQPRTPPSRTPPPPVHAVLRHFAAASPAGGSNPTPEGAAFVAALRAAMLHGAGVGDSYAVAAAAASASAASPGLWSRHEPWQADWGSVQGGGLRTWEVGPKANGPALSPVSVLADPMDSDRPMGGVWPRRALW